MVIVNINNGLIEKNIYILIFIVLPGKHWYELHKNSLFARIIIIDILIASKSISKSFNLYDTFFL